MRYTSLASGSLTAPEVPLRVKVSFLGLDGKLQHGVGRLQCIHGVGEGALGERVRGDCAGEEGVSVGEDGSIFSNLTIISSALSME
jgi:hypothetical protein